MPSPPALDSPSVATATQSGGTTGTIALTTAAANEVAFLFVQAGSTGATFTTTVTASGLTWTKRKSAPNTTLAYALTEIWSAKVPSIVSGLTVTVTTSVTMDNMALIICAASGCAAQIFDTNAGLPAGPVLSTGAATIPITVSTTQPDDMIFGVLGTNDSNVGAISPDGGIGFSQLAKVSNTVGTNYSSIAAQWNTYTSPQSGLSFNFGGTTGTTASMQVLADAITANVPSSVSQFMFAA